jgi:hypothetical protein
MISIHFCRWLKVMAVLHPIFTVYCIIVTGNHYLVDALAGGACFLVAFKLAPCLPKYGRGASWSHVTWPSASSSRRSGGGEDAAAPGWCVKRYTVEAFLNSSVQSMLRFHKLCFLFLCFVLLWRCIFVFVGGLRFRAEARSPQAYARVRTSDEEDGNKGGLV